MKKNAGKKNGNPLPASHVNAGKQTSSEIVIIEKKKIPEDALEFVAIDQAVIDLRDAYLKAKILGAKSRNDATHVAAATAARADAIISWNFRHIVRLDKMKGFNRINFELGYANLTIINPKEFRFDEK